MAFKTINSGASSYFTNSTQERVLIAVFGPAGQMGGATFGLGNLDRLAIVAPLVAHATNRQRVQAIVSDGKASLRVAD